MIISVSEAADIIKKGDLIAIPTETVYGLAADAFNVEAVKKTFEIKGRPADNPLIVHISSADQLKLLLKTFDPVIKNLSQTFWPGPLTLVAEKKSSVPDIVTGGLSSVAVRMPDHPRTRALIEKTGPLTAPSANRSGSPSATRPAHIEDDFGVSFPVLKGKHPSLGIESTVIDTRQLPLTILRPGAITAEMIEAKTGLKVQTAEKNSDSNQHSPGTRYTHYKPVANVKIMDSTPIKIEHDATYIFHSPDKPLTQKNIYNYLGNFDKLARNLYDHFRQADHSGHSQIFIENLPENQKSSIVSALKDRINRASSE